jgi:hypothetical protein
VDEARGVSPLPSSASVSAVAAGRRCGKKSVADTTIFFFPSHRSKPVQPAAQHVGRCRLTKRVVAPCAPMMTSTGVAAHQRVPNTFFAKEIDLGR